MQSYHPSQWAAWVYPGSNGSSDAFSGYPQNPYNLDPMDPFHAHQQHLVHHQHMARTTESKPRLSKEEVEVLEAEFQKNHKPTSSTKKALAEAMRVDNARINNWFQNRRAREKKENNIRQYEAKQRLEREVVDGDSDNVSDPLRSRDLVASSAPFPHITRPVRPASRTSDAGVSPDGEDTESPESNSSLLDQHSTTPVQSVQASTEISTTAALTPDIDDATDGSSSQQLSELFNTSNSSHCTDVIPDCLAQSQVYASLDDVSDKPMLSRYLAYSQALEDQDRATTISQENHFTQGYNGQLDTDLQGFQYTAIDLASRRNRRPAPLALNAARSHSAFGAPKTGLDLARRVDHSRTMRRVASASGPMRITKMTPSARSPFFDRSPESAFQLSRSPVMTGVTGSVAPPTPDTPMLAQRQNSLEAQATASMRSPDEQILSSSSTISDPVLTTPPTTPGYLDSMFSLNTACEMPLTDEALISGGLGGFSDFEMPRLPMGIPDYVTGRNMPSSQIDNTHMAQQMGSMGYGYAGAHTEYSWPDVSSSLKYMQTEVPDNTHYMGMSMGMANAQYSQVDVDSDGR